MTHKLCPVGVGSQVIPFVAGTSHPFAPSSAPGCPEPPALAASTQLAHLLLFVTLSRRHILIAEKTTCLVSSTAAHTLGLKFVFYTTSRYRPVYRPVSALQFQTRAARVMPAAPQTPSTEGARCRDSAWLQLSPFSAEVRHKQHFTASRRVIFTKAVAD